MVSREVAMKMEDSWWIQDNWKLFTFQNQKDIVTGLQAYFGGRSNRTWWIGHYQERKEGVKDDT
jgi:hypothetical protein